MYYQGKFEKLLKQTNSSSLATNNNSNPNNHPQQYQQLNTKLIRSTIERYTKSPDSSKNSYIESSPISASSIIGRNDNNSKSPMRYPNNEGYHQVKEHNNKKGNNTMIAEYYGMNLGNSKQSMNKSALLTTTTASMIANDNSNGNGNSGGGGGGNSNQSSSNPLQLNNLSGGGGSIGGNGSTTINNNQIAQGLKYPNNSINTSTNIKGLSPSSQVPFVSGVMDNNNPNNPNPNSNNEMSYKDKVSKLLQKISKLRHEVDLYQEKEMQLLNRIGNLEKENKAYQGLLDEKEKKIGELVKKAKEDKAKILQYFQNEKELSNVNTITMNSGVNTTANTTTTTTAMNSSNNLNIENIKYGEEGGMNKFLEMLESKKNDRVLCLNKSIQTIDIEYDNAKKYSSKSCEKCNIVISYCDTLAKKLSEIEESSRYLMNNCSSLKGQLDETKKTEENYMRVYTDMESRYYEIERELRDKNKKWLEYCSELRTLKELLYHYYMGLTNSSNSGNNGGGGGGSSSLNVNATGGNKTSLRINTTPGKSPVKSDNSALLASSSTLVSTRPSIINGGIGASGAGGGVSAGGGGANASLNSGGGGGGSAVSPFPTSLKAMIYAEQYMIAMRKV